MPRTAGARRIGCVPGSSVIIAAAWTLLGAWGVLNLTEGDWFIGTLMLVCAVAGLCSLVARARGERRR